MFLGVVDESIRGCHSTKGRFSVENLLRVDFDLNVKDVAANIITGHARVCKANAKRETF